MSDALRAVLKSALRKATVHDMYPVTAVGIEISSGFRTALIRGAEHQAHCDKLPRRESG